VDFFGRLGPDEWFGFGVPVRDPAADVGLEFDHALVDAAAYELVGEIGEPAETWLIQLDPVGVKCMWNRGWRASQALMSGVLWVP
jgi:hypothetical protein